MRNMNNKGIGLVEAIIAIGFAVVLVVTLLGLTAFNAQNATNVSLRQDAITQTSVQIERLKFLKDRDFKMFLKKVSDCSVGLDASVYPCSVNESGNDIKSCGLDTPVCFATIITTIPSSDLTSKEFTSEIELNLISFYFINKTKFSTATSTLFTNWRTRQ